MYWHVEDRYLVVHSQVLKASVSEVAAMAEGAVRHDTTMNLAGNYVDSYGQSEVGFGITRLLEVDLQPRIKRINTTRLFRPESAGAADRLALAGFVEQRGLEAASQLPRVVEPSP